jgi:hypothetical protein
MNKFLIIISILFSISSFGQKTDECLFFSDYSNPSDWTQVGSLVEISGDVLNFIDGAPDGSIGSTAAGIQRRVHASIGSTLNANDQWIARVEFTPLAVGTHNGQPHTGHTILALTAGIQEPFNNCSNLACTGYPTGIQDGLIVYYGSNNPPDGNLFFGVRSRDGSSESGSTLIVNNSLGSTFYVQFERISSTETILSVFDDVNYSNHIPGSPVNFSIPSTVTGLTTVQHGNQVRGQIERELTGYIDNLCINRVNANETCFFQSDYSNALSWTQVGSLVEVSGGLMNYINGAPDGSIGSTAAGIQRRVYANIGTTLNASDTWKASIEFMPQSVGELNGQPHTGHTIMALTAGTQEPFNNCPDLACTGYPAGNQDGLIAYYGTNNPPDGNIFFGIRARDGSIETGSNLIYNNTLGSLFYIEMERTSSTEVVLRVFDDPSFSNHVLGSPVTFAIPSSITGLNTVQHGNQVRGQIERELTGFVDNLCISSNSVVGVNNFLDKEFGFIVYPNPTHDKLLIDHNSLKEYSVFIISELGQIIKEIPDYQNGSEINLTELQRGVYYFKIIIGEFISIKKVIIE